MDKYPILLISLYLIPFLKKNFKGLLKTNKQKNECNATNSRRLLKDRKQNVDDKTLAGLVNSVAVIEFL